MELEAWTAALAALDSSARFFADCDVIDLSFTGGDTIEVYVAVSPEQQSRGLSEVSMLDLDVAGMLFCFAGPTYTAFTVEKMMIDLDIAWYDENGVRVKACRAQAGTPGHLLCPESFTYVVETPAGQLPAGDLVLSRG